MNKSPEKTPRLAQHFKKAGFAEKQATIYATLLDLGGAYPSRIAEVTGLNRSTVYKILLELSVKGLITEIEKKNKLFYQLEQPNKLKRFADMQISLAEDHRESILRLIPEVEELWAAHTNKPRVIYYEGIEEMRTMYEDHVMVAKPYEMLALYNASEIMNVLSPQWIKSVYMKRKAKLGITTRAILPNTADDRRFVPMVYRGLPRKFHPEIRYIPGDLFPFESEITVYGTRRISIADLSKIHPIGVIIDDEIIYQTMRMVFELVWRVARPEQSR